MDPGHVRLTPSTSSLLRGSHPGDHPLDHAEGGRPRPRQRGGNGRHRRAPAGPQTYRQTNGRRRDTSPPRCVLIPTMRPTNAAPFSTPLSNPSSPALPPSSSSRSASAALLLSCSLLFLLSSQSQARLILHVLLCVGCARAAAAARDVLASEAVRLDRCGQPPRSCLT